jgi:type IV pilus assembly protein PilM
MPISNSYTGMVITSSYIRVVDLVKKGDGLFLNCFVDIPLVNDDPFHVDNAAQVKAELTKRKMKSRTVNILAVDPSLIVRQVKSPQVPREEMVESLRIVEQEQVPYPMDNAAIDAMQFVGEEGEQVPVLMAVIEGEVAKKYNDFANNTGLKHVGISIRPTAISALLEHSTTIDKEDVVLVISIGRDVTGVHFYQNSELKFQRDINVGDVTIFSDAIGKYEMAEHIADVTVNDVELLKRQFGIPSDADFSTPGVKGITGGVFLSKIQPTLEKLIMEITRSVDFFKSDQRVSRINNCYVIGEAATLKNMTETLTDEIGITCKAYDPFADILEGGLEHMGDKRNSGSQYAAVLGTALDMGNRINLLPVKMRYSFENVVPKLMAISVGIAYLAFIFGVSAAASVYQKSAKYRMENYRAKIHELGEVDRSIEVIAGKVEAVKAILATNPKTVGRDIQWGDIFTQAGLVMPEDAALETVAVKFGGAMDYAADGQMYSKEVILHGRVRGTPGKQVETLKKFVENMSGSGIFQHATILSVSRETATGGQDHMLFNVAADIVRTTGAIQ